MAKMKKYLFVMRHMPNTGSHVQETLDMILTTAAFDQQVTVLFADDGVFQLKRRQNPLSLGLKDTAAVFTALALYDVHDLYVETESLQSRGLRTDDLILPVRDILRCDLGRFMQQHDVLVPD